ncbi:MAG: hypothetical protein ACLQBL_29145 [Polyangiaceae bacterium]
MGARARVAAVGLVAVLGAFGSVGACGGTSTNLSGPAPGGATTDGGGDATSSANQSCVPGAQSVCTCSTGGVGSQVCNSSGVGFGPCTGCTAAAPDGGQGVTDATSPGSPDTSTGPGSDDASDDTGTVVTEDSGPPADSGPVVPCPTGLTCNVTCSDGGTTSISGTVYDPAIKNPLYNVAVYIPATPLVPLPRGVPTGADACSCQALFQSGAIQTTTTAVDGTFTLNDVPVGVSVPLVIQVGKWRRLYNISITACEPNPQPSLSFLGTVPAGDTNDNIPDIAVSTGGADTLECLMRRIGMPTTEYIAGAGTTGHVHIFSGGDPTALGVGGLPEAYPMTGAPESSTSLWDTTSDLMPYDLVLLSCESEETYDANPANLESYLNAGGRVFASHYHYAWFSGPIDGTSGQTYTAPTDWGTNLATWAADVTDSAGPIGGIIDLTLNGSTATFSKGVALDSWLGETNALGQNGVAAGELSIYEPRFNAIVSAANEHSQPWIIADSTSGASGNTMYFSFDTPVDLPELPDGGPPSYCGRAVFSDLHVAGDPSVNDTGNTTGPGPPTGCDYVNLSPQEKALEFMLFDLSSCVIPDTIAPPKGR